MSRIVSTGKTIASPEFYEKKRREKQKRRIIFSILGVSIFVILVFVSRLEGLQIKEVSSQGANVIGAETLNNFVSQYISGNYLWVFPKSNFLIYPKRALIESLKEEYPRLKEIEVSLEGMDSISLLVTEREPYALYCPESLCYFVDETGFIFDPAPIFSEGVYLSINKEEELDSPRGKFLLEESRFRELLGLVRQIGEKFNLRLETLYLGKDIILSFGMGGKIVWKEGSDSNLIYNNLEAFMKSDSIKENKDFWSQVLELDLRTPNKVFYKLKITEDGE